MSVRHVFWTGALIEYKDAPREFLPDLRVSVAGVNDEDLRPLCLVKAADGWVPVGEVAGDLPINPSEESRIAAARLLMKAGAKDKIEKSVNVISLPKALRERAIEKIKSLPVEETPAKASK